MGEREAEAAVKGYAYRIVPADGSYRGAYGNYATIEGAAHAAGEALLRPVDAYGAASTAEIMRLLEWNPHAMDGRGDYDMERVGTVRLRPVLERP